MVSIELVCQTILHCLLSKVISIQVHSLSDAPQSSYLGLSLLREPAVYCLELRFLCRIKGLNSVDFSNVRRLPCVGDSRDIFTEFTS